MEDTIENRVVRLETVIEHLATKEDISKLENSMLKWGFGLILTNIGTVLAISYFFQRIIVNTG